MGREKKLLIIGAGQYGYVAKETAEATCLYDKIAFIDEFAPIAIGKTKDVGNFLTEYANAFVAIGNTNVRLEIIDTLKTLGYRQVTLIHPKAYVSPSAEIAEGCIVEPNAVIHSNTRIGIGCLISAGAVVNHNAVVEDGCHIDCNATVEARSVVKAGIKVNSGQVYGNEVNYV